MKASNGYFIISLDFELYWGVRDKRTLEDYQENIRNVRVVVPRLLELFKRYDIHCTWATVGFLFNESKEELIHNIPARIPDYANKKLNPYKYLAAHTGANEQEDIFHYAPSLIRLIKTYPHQEIGSHTYSHYYCLEKGQDVMTFEDDLKAALKVARKFDLQLKSLVFPRNQVNNEYLEKCRELGFQAYRGCENSWIYEERSGEDESLLRRAVRLADAYLNFSGYHTTSPEQIMQQQPVNIASSRFLRPYTKEPAWLRSLRLKRILSAMTFAAKQNHIFHLWWHPHNFGKYTEENFAFLAEILNHYALLHKRHGMESRNMGEMAAAIIQPLKNGE